MLSFGAIRYEGNELEQQGQLGRLILSPHSERSSSSSVSFSCGVVVVSCLSWFILTRISFTSSVLRRVVGSGISSSSEEIGVFGFHLSLVYSLIYLSFVAQWNVRLSFVFDIP